MLGPPISCRARLRMPPSLAGHLLAILGAIAQALGEPDQMRLIAFVLQPLLYQPQSGDG